MTHSTSGTDSQQSAINGSVRTTRFKHLFTNRIAVAVSWTAFGTFSAQIIRVAGTLIMTRLLVPEMFGIMALVLTVHLILHNLLDVGLRPAMIQSRRAEDSDFANTT